MSKIEAQYELYRLFTMHKKRKRSDSTLHIAFDRSVWSGMHFKRSEQACVEWIDFQLQFVPKIQDLVHGYGYALDARFHVWTWQPVGISVRADLDFSFVTDPKKRRWKVQVGPGQGKTIWVGINSWGPQGQRVWERRTKADVLMKRTGTAASFAITLTRLQY